MSAEAKEIHKQKSNLMLELNYTVHGRPFVSFSGNKWKILYSSFEQDVLYLSPLQPRSCSVCRLLSKIYYIWPSSL